MLLLGIPASAALILPLSISAIPLNSRALSQAGVPNAHPSLSQSNLTDTSLYPNSPEHSVTCFSARADLNLTAVAQDCAIVLNDIILRIDGLFVDRAFSRQHYKNSAGKWVPSRWDSGQCSIYAKSTESGAVDVFPLFEVALTANEILSECVTSHRKTQGGLMPIGSDKGSYYVGVQGRSSDSKVNAIGGAEVSNLPHFEASKRTPDSKRAIAGPTALELQSLDSQVSPIPLSKALISLDATANLKADHEIDCFPRGSRLPDASIADCRFIINSIILGMKDPLRAQTWGYTDTADINLSLPDNWWTFKDCFIRVKNIDEKQVDRFRPVDVAEVAQRIVQECVVNTKEPLGGNADVGWLAFPRSFYVVVSGTAIERNWETQRNDTSLPSDGSQTLEDRASLSLPEKNPVSLIMTENLRAGSGYSVNCFDPAVVHRLKPAIPSDCDFIINEIILRLPNPMKEQTFGYTDADDIDLSEGDNNHWIYGQCAIFIRNLGDKVTVRDRFRYLDVAFAAHRIAEQCVEGAKYAIGGVSDIGTVEDKFYVGLSGFDSKDPGNGRILKLASGTMVPSPSSAIPALLSKNNTHSSVSHKYNGTKPASLVQRSGNSTKILEGGNRFGPSASCIRSGMPAAQKIVMQDCTDAATVLLRDPKVLAPQLFTTEPTGGIKMPFVQNNKSCYMMMDTKSELSISDTIPLLTMVYWALEIMLKCISGREEGFGGISVLDRAKGIFVSVTGVDPKYVGLELASLSDESTSAIADVAEN